MNRLLLHADDFGFNEPVTRGIIDGLSRGLLTGTSVLANAPAAPLAIDLWTRLERLRVAGELPSAAIRNRLCDAESPFDLGVHLNLTQGRPLIGSRYPGGLLDRAGRFLSPARLFLKLVLGGRRWQSAIRDELAEQIEWLLDHGLRPTHLNGHQYVEMMPVVRELVPNLARRYGIGSVRVASEPGHWRTSLRPGLRLANCGVSGVKYHYAVRFLRLLDTARIDHADAYFGASHAGRIDLPMMRRFLRLARSHAVSEIAFHPGQYSKDEISRTDDWHDPLAEARSGELRLLNSPELAELLVAASVRLGRLGYLATSHAHAA
ncbi:MAG TPA: ChbG/HpnK family deacetylase [Pirellulales bacterium]|nr:ChbG/HpnK family deacetylase [Pirellulales bacterium]